MTTTRPGGENISSTRNMLNVFSSAKVLNEATKVAAAPQVVHGLPTQAAKVPPKNAKRRPPSLPVENIELNPTEKDKNNKNETKSFHTVFKIYIDKVLYFFKKNENDSPMSPMEAAVSEICRFFVDDLSPPGKAVYKMEGNKPVYIGVISQALENFKSLIDEPLTEEDLKISVLEDGSYPIEKLDRLDEEYRAARDARGLPIDLNTLDKHKKLRGRVPVEDLIHYRKLKDLTNVLVLCYYLKDDDAHRGNLGNGNFDHDMKMWNIFYKFKVSDSLVWRVIQQIDGSFRRPDRTTFKMTHEDLDNFPDLKHDSRFIWCNKTNPYGKLGTTVRDFIGKLIDLTKNAFSDKENNLFKGINALEAVQFNKNKMFLRLAIHDSRVYDQLLGLHLDGKLASPLLDNKSIRGVMKEDLIERQKEFKSELMCSSQFEKFMREHGKYAMSVIEDKYNKFNDRITTAIEAQRRNDDETGQQRTVDNLGYTRDLLVSTRKLREQANTICKLFRMAPLFDLEPIKNESPPLQVVIQPVPEAPARVTPGFR